MISSTFGSLCIISIGDTKGNFTNPHIVPPSHLPYSSWLHHYLSASVTIPLSPLVAAPLALFVSTYHGHPWRRPSAEVVAAGCAAPLPPPAAAARPTGPSADAAHRTTGRLTAGQTVLLRLSSTMATGGDPLCVIFQDSTCVLCGIPGMFVISGRRTSSAHRECME